MSKLIAHCRQSVFATTGMVTVVTLFASSTVIRAATAAPTDTFLCTPVAVATYSARVHVRCSTGAPPNASIFYFAVCTSPDSASASRFLSVFTTAKATAKNLSILYSANDTSGTACGCAAGDCRLTSGAEVQQ